MVDWRTCVNFDRKFWTLCAEVKNIVTTIFFFFYIFTAWVLYVCYIKLTIASMTPKTHSCGILLSSFSSTKKDREILHGLLSLLSIYLLTAYNNDFPRKHRWWSGQTVCCTPNQIHPVTSLSFFFTDFWRKGKKEKAAIKEIQVTIENHKA